MKDIEKLRVLLPYWTEHNQGHETELLRWAEQLAADSPDIAALLRRAAADLHSAEHALIEALDKAGGPLAAAGHSHPSGHHHHH